MKTIQLNISEEKWGALPELAFLSENTGVPLFMHRLAGWMSQVVTAMDKGETEVTIE